MEKLHDIFARSSSPVFAIDGTRRIVYQNDAFARIISPAPPAATTGRRCYEVIRANCARAHGSCIACNPDCPVGKSLIQGEPVSDFDLAIPRQGGKPVLVNVSAFPVAESKPTAVFIMRPVAVSPANVVSPTTAITESDNSKPPQELTAREQQVLRMLASGLSTRHLAARLNISYVTARNHIQNIFMKLGVHSRVAAIGLAFRRNLF